MTMLVGYEGAGADGAFVCPSLDVDVSTLSILDRWRWAIKQTTIEFVPFDVKSMSLASTTKAHVDYAFRQYQKHHGNPVEVYIFVFQDLTDYIAIVPKSVWENSSGGAYGTAPLFSRVPGWLLPFMVYLPQIGEAVDNLLRIDRSY